jgi:hypothetical protein
MGTVLRRVQTNQSLRPRYSNSKSCIFIQIILPITLSTCCVYKDHDTQSPTFYLIVGYSNARRSNVKSIVSLTHFYYCLGNHGTGGGRLVLPVSRKLSGGSVVTSQSVDSGFDQNQSKLGVLVLSVSLQVPTNLNGLLDKHVQVFGNFRGKAVGLEDSNNLLSGDRLDLGNTIGVTQDDTNLRGGQTLLGKLAHVVFDIGSRDLVPRRRSALVRKGTLGDTLSGSMHTTHAEKRKKR